MILEFAKYKQFEYYKLFSKVKKLFFDISDETKHTITREEYKWNSVLDITIYYKAVDDIWLHYDHEESTFRIGRSSGRFFKLYSYLYYKFNGKGNVNEYAATFGIDKSYNDIHISLEDYKLYDLTSKYNI